MADNAVGPKAAVGLIEVVGLLAAVEAADVCLKSANVRLLDCENTSGALLTVKVCGDVGSVKAAVEAGKAAASRVGTVVSTLVLARPAEGIGDMLGLDKYMQSPAQVEESKAGEVAEPVVEQAEAAEVPEPEAAQAGAEQTESEQAESVQTELEESKLEESKAGQENLEDGQQDSSDTSESENSDIENSENIENSETEDSASKPKSNRKKKK
jgi:microcompartment protein CcmL/EutN